MKLIEGWRQKSGRGLWRGYSAEQKELRNGIVKVLGFWEKLQRGQSISERPHRSRFSFS